MSIFRQLDPDSMSVGDVHRLLLAGVAPRPIALVATMSAAGNANLSPFSFFNAFGANPPIVVFSPAYRGRDGTPKHTFLNLTQSSEYTISIVSYAMVEQISLASSDYPAGVDEFIKAGLTKLPSVKVQPPGVAESPFVMECRLLQHIDLGGKPASGNLMIGEVVQFHVRTEVYTGNRLDPHKIDAVARMGYEWYCRASGDALFALSKPTHSGIGFDLLPESIRNSTILTGNDLAKLAGVENLPDQEAMTGKWKARMEGIGSTPFSLATFLTALHSGQPDDALASLLPMIQSGRVETDLVHRLAQAYLQRGEVDMAWEVLTAELAVAG